MYELRHYFSPDGQDLFRQWLDGLRDRQAQARIAARMTRLNNGNSVTANLWVTASGNCVLIGGRATGFTTQYTASA